MAQFDAPKEGAVASEFLRTSRVADPRAVAATSEQTLLSGQAAQFIFCVPGGSVVTLGGIDGEALRELVDQAEHIPDDRRALLVQLRPAGSVEAYVGQVIAILAETAMRLWPVWFTDVSFGGCRGDTLGLLAAGAIARSAAEKIAGLSPSWAEAAAKLALDNLAPRVIGTLPAIELAQLALAISRYGLVLVADAHTAICTGLNPAAVVHALEWIAQHSQGAVVALFPELPRNEPPFDRILYGARQVIPVVSAIEPDAAGAVDHEAWIAPWRGLPHPLSEIEQRLAKMLAGDVELAPLFRFNQVIETGRGSRPRVDLVWTDGRLVVELDGYPDHGSMRAFIHDRHRDYELALSGYTVLRLANDEVAQDYGKAIEKIRDLVRLCRARPNAGGMTWPIS